MKVALRTIGAALCAAAIVAGPVSSAAPGAGPNVTTKVVKYNVSISVTSFVEVKTPLGTTGTQVRNEEIDWSGTWKNVGFKILSLKKKVYGVIDTKPTFTGSIEASAKYSYHDPPGRFQAVQCDGSLAPRKYPARLNVVVYPRIGSNSKITFLGEPNDGGAGWAAAVDADEKSHCSDHVAIIGAADLTWTAPSGVEVNPNADLAVLDWQRAGPSSHPPFPIDQILSGHAFTIDAGTHTENSGTSTVERESARITFTPKGKLEITKVDLKDIDNAKLRYLSVSNDYDTDEGAIFDRNTRVNGTITIKGEKDNSLKSLDLEIYDGALPVATARLAPGPRSQLIGKPFGADETLAITNPPACPKCLFELPQSEAAKVDRENDGQLELRVKAVAEDGQEAEKTWGSVPRLIRYLGKNRYGPRDLNRGGDDWVKPSVKKVLESAAAGHCFGDMSNMNGGSFAPDHQTHQDGFDVDVKYDSPTACKNGGSFSNALASDAQRIIDDLNNPAYGSRIGTLYVTFSYVNADPVWNAIKNVTLNDRRRACLVVKNVAGHDTHVHWRIDFTDATPGKCPGDPGVPP